MSGDWGGAECECWGVCTCSVRGSTASQIIRSHLTIEPIKAIETRYKGYRFRSRLEARWAIFLDALRINWRYEFEGFDLGGTYYLPDFWVQFARAEAYPAGTPPYSGLWLEIKPGPPLPREVECCRLLAKASGHCVYLAAGNIGLQEFDTWKMHPSWSKPEFTTWNVDSTPGWLFSNILLSYLSWDAVPGGPPYDADVVAAFDSARSARFEHGESP